ncbi:MAG: kinase [Verrucomicrobia bacterium]|nr:MAG: kinase [Verrucomicrobiota bacterium]
MIISRTPFRISFFGGGTDFPLWYRKYGGCVLGTTIDKYCYLTCRFLPPFFEHRTRVVYSKIEVAQRPEDIAHPAVRAALKFLKIKRGVEIHHDGDLPARTGMGTSSAFTVGLLHALHALCGQIPTRERLATESIHLEQDVLKEVVGSQDQVHAAYGGFSHILFQPSGQITVRPMTLAGKRIAELNAHLMLFYTGIQRTSATIAASHVNSLNSNAERLQRMKALVDEAVSVLAGRDDIERFGELLGESWAAKRRLTKAVSNSYLDEIYDKAVAAGALAGKLTGAGGGGFMLLFVPPQKQARVRKALKHLLCLPFNFESSGSQIIFFDRETDYSTEEIARQRQQLHWKQRR